MGQSCDGSERCHGGLVLLALAEQEPHCLWILFDVQAIAELNQPVGQLVFRMLRCGAIHGVILGSEMLRLNAQPILALYDDRVNPVNPAADEGWLVRARHVGGGRRAYDLVAW